MNRVGWSVAFVFSVVLGLYLFIIYDDEQPPSQTDSELSMTPTYEAINLDSKLYDDEGLLSHQVSADKMEHYQQLGFMVFDNPVYTVFLESGEPWRITAEEGTLYGSSRIQLEHNVKIINLNTTEFVKQIQTEYIEINLDQKTLFSDQEVEIFGDNYSVKSIGIQGNLATQQYELKQHVQSQYFPQ
ncbi:LPS export ABC transporter periplasmic protein LptC [Agaribacter flavus]|uniref:Lipopolysaccharide export system protein LptC n=1 Tax=Agaribacter flavus TaxID=1902781 RepID=A0ABV7FQV6_9ALTE